MTRNKKEMGRSEMLDFKRRAVALGLCGVYKEQWDCASGARELVDIALDANGIEFMAESVGGGWGLSPGYLSRTFGEYINGEYLSRQGGYSSELWVSHSGEVVPRGTLSLFVDCEGCITIPKGRVCRVYLTSCCDVEIACEGECEVLCYGGVCQVRRVTGGGVARVRELSPKFTKK